MSYLETTPPPKKTKRKSGSLWIFIILVLIGVGVGYAWHAGYFSSGDKKKDHANAPVPVVAAVAQKADVGITDQALGTVTPLATVTVQTQIAGQLVDVGFQEGQMIKAGDFLAQIDPRPYQAALDQAIGTLQRDQGLLEEAKTDFVRYQKLVEQDSISRQQAEDQQYVVKQDEGTVKLDQAAVENAKINLSYCHITAPVSGRIGLRLVDPGNFVQVGNATASATASTNTAGTTTGIAVVAQLQPITAIFTLPEDDLPPIMKRLGTGAELEVTAYNRTQATKLATGKLLSVDNQIDVSTGTVKMRAQFDNADNTLFPNQFVNVTLLVDTLKDATTIPSAAIQRGTPGTFVYLINPDHTVKMQKITLGPSQGDTIAVTEGLSPGDMVVTDGADKLRDGSKITLPGEKNSSGGSSGGHKHRSQQ